MSAAEQPIPSEALVVADRMGVRGYRTHPLYPRAKNPVLNDWPNAASCDPADHAGWWPVGSERGLGWAMGVQGSGEFLVAVDVDVDKGGRDSLNQLGLENPWLVDLLMSGLFAQTGSGGFHFVIAVPPSVGAQLSNRARILPGIDIRSAGGQIAVFPSIHPNGRQYRWAEGHAPWEVDPVADERVCDLLVRLAERPAVASVPAAPRSSGGDTPADQVRQHERWESWLPRWGWTYLRTLPNGDQLWKRPGKTDRGHSAVLHPDGAFVIFSTEIPPILEAAGKPTRGGEGVSVSLFAAIAAYEHGGDQSAAGRWARQQPWFVGGSPATEVLLSGGTAVTPGSSDAPVAVPGATQGSSVGYLDEEFWSSRPMFEHIRQAARHRRVGPDACLLNVLARWAAIVQPTYKLPPEVGKVATLDLAIVVTGRTSQGKSTVMGCAADLLPSRDEAILWDLPMGSGEGIAETYMVFDVDDNGKPTKTKILDTNQRRAAHFVVDEIATLTAVNERKGSTLLGTICTAVTGGALGQANAGLETRRIIGAGKVRFVCVINMQDKRAHLVFSSNSIDGGFTGRLIFARAGGGPTRPPRDQRPEWPGPLELEPPPKIGEETILTYAPEIIDEIDLLRWEALDDDNDDNDAHSHAMLIRCKIAGLLALADGRRTHVTVEDWDLATRITRNSEAVYARIQSIRTEVEANTRRANGYARADVEIATQSRKDLVTIDSRKERLIATVLGEPEKRWGKAKLRSKVCGGPYYHLWEDVLAAALRSGRVVMDGSAVIAP